MKIHTADIVLVPSGGSASDRAIVRAQERMGFSPDACRFVHVLVVINWNDEAPHRLGVESSPSQGVHVVDDIAVKYPGSTIMRVKCLDGADQSAHRNRIAVTLLSWTAVGLRYDWASIIRFKFRWLAWLLCKLGFYQRGAREMICTELVVRAFEFWGTRVVDGFYQDGVPPAALYASSRLLTVGVIS